MNYTDFIAARQQFGGGDGFAPVYMHEGAFDFQRKLIEWSLLKGRAAIFADCGLGKTLMQLVWAENVVRHTNRRVLILTPLAVARQTVNEGAKFGIECHYSRGGELSGRIVVANYERLHHFDMNDFAGVVCDESAILKNFDGKRKAAITAFIRRMRYRLLCTATPAPNDYVELGTTSEALGELGYMDMLSRFFRNDEGSNQAAFSKSRFGQGRGSNIWRFKRHAERPFWRWVCSWARAVRHPSDIDPSFDDSRFKLPELIERETRVAFERALPGKLFAMPARGLTEQRQETRLTLRERCELAAQKCIEHKGCSIAWCHLNDEGELLEELIPGARQVSGSQSDDEKEEILNDFQTGQFDLVVKPKITAHGLNWQHCQHQCWFPSHSFEQYFQGVRRCWRFGQEKPVYVDIIATPGSDDVLRNLQRKMRAAEEMFKMLLEEMWKEIRMQRSQFNATQKAQLPSWLSRRSSASSTPRTTATAAKC